MNSELESQVSGSQAYEAKVDASKALTEIPTALESVSSDSGLATADYLRSLHLKLQGAITEWDIVNLIARGVLDNSHSDSSNDERWHRLRVGEVMSAARVNLTESDDHDIFTALSIFRRDQELNYLPILDHQGFLVGVVTPERIRAVLQPANILRLRLVKDEMTTHVVTASATTSILRIAQMMAAHQVNCIVIHRPMETTTSARHQLIPIGIISAQDVVQAQYLGLDLTCTLAQTIMSDPPLYLKPTDSLWHAHQEMQARKMRRLVVCGAGGELLGIITQTSLLRMLDPTEMFRVVRKLQQSVEDLQAEKLKLLEDRAAQLEQQVQERTAKLYEQLQRERLLSKLSFQIHQSLNLKEILNTTVAEVQQVLEADRVVVYHLTETGQNQQVAESVALSGHPLSQTQLSPEVTKYHLDVLAIDPVCAVTNVKMTKFSDGEQHYLDAENIQAYLLVSLQEDDHSWGILSVHHCSGTRHWQPSEITLLQQLSTQLAIAIQQAQLYQQVQDLNTDLEQQVQQRTAELRQKIKELQRLNILKDEFLSTVSHELRTPLANMKMAIHMVNLVLPDDERLQRYVEILQSECTRETNLINDLLDLQKLEASTAPIALEEIDLSTWLPPLIQPFYSRTQERQQRLQVNSISPLPKILTSSASLERVLAELLNNACKYTPDGEMIQFDVEYETVQLPPDPTDVDPDQAPTTKSLVRFRVSNPAEIAEGELPRIFEKFYRVPNADPWKQGGTGLGLALVEKLVEQLNGIIKVKSAEGLTCFTVELPA
ncbi:MAG: CBS domain-containing protein [Microcoleaceae cyanobacterium]